MGARPAKHPTRVAHLAAARARFPELSERLLPALLRGDPLADAVVEAFAGMDPGRGQRCLTRALARGIQRTPEAPEALRALFASIDEVPAWVDWRRIERAGALLFRAGIIGGTVLGAKSLVTGYCSPGGNKPLAFSGQLSRRDRMVRRLAETSRFVVDVCSPAGMRRFGAGYASTVRVRIVHAQVRRMLLRTEAFRVQDWGLPINQHDMLGTTLLFSAAFIEGVRAFGLEVSPQLAEDYLHLWRYNGHVIGVEAELLPRSWAEAMEVADFIALTQGAPDDDARALVHALVQSPRYSADATPSAQAAAGRQVAVGYAITRALIGDAMADALALPKTPARLTLPVLRTVLQPVEKIGRRLPGYEHRWIRAGQRYWRDAIELGLAGVPARFDAPTRLEGSPSRTRSPA